LRDPTLPTPRPHKSDFVVIPSRQALYHQFNSFLKVIDWAKTAISSSAYKTHFMPIFMVTGEPGTGKTAFITRILTILQQPYTILLATTPLEERRSLLKRAFETGHLVFMDEFNTQAIALEADIHFYLNQPTHGFAIIGAQNSEKAVEHRASSAALCSRYWPITLSPLTAIEQETVSLDFRLRQYQLAEQIPDENHAALYRARTHHELDQLESSMLMLPSRVMRP
jgi:hypothetical protein